MVLCHPSSGNTGPCHDAVPQTLFTHGPLYLPSPLLSLAASPERFCSLQQLTVDSVSSLLPGSAAPQGPSHSKRPHGICFGHPSHRRQHSNQPHTMEKWRQHTKGEQTVLSTNFEVYSSISGSSNCIFGNFVPSFDKHIIKQKFSPDTSDSTPPYPFLIRAINCPSMSRSVSQEQKSSCLPRASRLPWGSELRGLTAPTSCSHPNCEHTLWNTVPQFTQMSCKNITNARGLVTKAGRFPLATLQSIRPATQQCTTSMLSLTSLHSRRNLRQQKGSQASKCNRKSMNYSGTHNCWEWTRNCRWVSKSKLMNMFACQLCTLCFSSNAGNTVSQQKRKMTVLKTLKNTHRQVVMQTFSNEKASNAPWIV